MALGEKSFFWDKPAGELTPEEAAYYEYAAQDLASVYECMYTTGICPAMAVSSPEDNPEEYIGSSLRCSAGEGLSVVVSPGAANIKGRLYLATLPVTVTVAAGVVTDVVLRMDLQSEKPTVTLQAKQRASGVSLAQNLSHESLVYEIAVATVDVPVGSIQTDLSMITDQRLNTTAHPTDGKPVSGLMRSIPYVETLGIWEEWTALKEQIEGIIADEVSGVIPDLSVTTSKFAPDAKAPYAGVADEAKNGVYTLTHQGIQSGAQRLTGLNGATGILSCQFKAVNPYTTSSPNFSIDGVTYTPKLQNGETPDSDLFAANAIVTCVVDTSSRTINFKSGGGLSNSKLALANATAADVAEGKTFYAGNKALKTGTLVPYKYATGTATWTHQSSGFTVTVEVGFRPSMIAFYSQKSLSSSVNSIVGWAYNSSTSNPNYFTGMIMMNVDIYSSHPTYAGYLGEYISVTDTSFTVKSITGSYVAAGDPVTYAVVGQ
ncbi:MAG TPA: hypothetical protein IAB55_06390 [Candidatus Merdivicinus faecavium]|nr:hypothetical protein [Candidatus Merdivicinus faecavium]